jgi:hypothetical protein
MGVLVNRKPDPEPEGLRILVGNHFNRKAVFKECVWLDYASTQQSLWNGTVYIYKIVRRPGLSPFDVYAFKMMNSEGRLSWQFWPEGPRTLTPLDAVKTARREVLSGGHYAKLGHSPIGE